MVAWQGMFHTLLRPGNEEYLEPAVGRCTDLLWEGGVAKNLEWEVGVAEDGGVGRWCCRR